MKRSIRLATTWLLLLSAACGASAAQNDNPVLKSLKQTAIDAAAHGDRATLDKLLSIDAAPDSASRSKMDVLTAPPLEKGSPQLPPRTYGNAAVVTGIDRHATNTHRRNPAYATGRTAFR